MDILIDRIKKIISIVNESNIAEFSTTHKGFKLTLKKFNSNSEGIVPVTSGNLITPESTKPSFEKDSLISETTESVKGDFSFIKSPIVGTFYRSSSPESKPFVEEGSKISKGTTVCIIEAMKVMNDLKSELKGEVVEFLVKDGSVVEYDQPIIKLKVN